MEILKVDHLTKDYGSGRGVFDVSFSINEGEVFGFLGPNGAGKSTTIRHLMGFSKPQEGKCEIFGQESFSHYDKILKQVGYIPGEIALPDGLTGKEFLKMMSDMRGNEDPEKEKEMLELFQLDDASLRQNCKRMSLGVKRKLAVVAAFAGDPKVLILDEPTSGLDPVMQKVFVNYIKEEKKRGKTILLSSHIFSEVDATCDRIAIIKDGRIVSLFNADDLRHKTTKNYHLHFLSKEAYEGFLAKAEQNPDFKIIEKHPENLWLGLLVDDKNINEMIALASAYPLKRITNIKETLQDYFMKFYREDKNFGGAL